MEQNITNLIVELNSVCNNNCVYCYQKEKQKQGTKSFNYLKERITFFRKKKVKNIDFTGGEPTLSPLLIPLIKTAKKLGYENINLVSNGRRIAYPDYCTTLVRAGINRAVLSYDGPSDAITSAMTRTPGSFSQTRKAIVNLKKQGIEVGGTIVITRINYKHIKDTIEQLYGLGMNFINVQFLLPQIEFTRRLPSSIFITYGEVYPYIAEALSVYNKKIKINVHFIPFCYLKGFEDNLKESMKYNRFVVNFEGKDYNMGKHLERGSIKTEKCNKCEYKEKCIGFFFSYAKELGIYNELKELKKGIDSIFYSYLSHLEEKLQINNQILNEAANILFQKPPKKPSDLNQKFDFSITSDKTKTVRFSFNDFGEHDESHKKYLKVYSLFPNHCDPDKIKELFRIMNTKKHQTTFGVELREKEQDTRLKLYFEEFRYNQKFILEKLKKICKVIDYDFNSIAKIAFKEKIVMIGIDFLFDQKINLKIYNRLEILSKEIRVKLPQKFLNTFPEKEDEFYFMSYRFSDNKLISTKVYKIFDIRKNRHNASDNLSKVKEFLQCLEENILTQKIQETCRFMDENGNILVPASFSIEPKDKRTALYFTVRGMVDFYSSSDMASV